MANARGKSIDNTHLSIDQAENRGFIHRDYIAHCLRWTHVAKFLAIKQRYKYARVLDIGCGVDVPLAKMLYSSRYIVQDYVGLDYNKPEKFKMEPFHTGKFPISAYGNSIFPDCIEFDEDQNSVYNIKGFDDRHQMPNVITCFEVLEHVEPSMVVKMLRMINYMLQCNPYAVAFISTPNYDSHVGHAANHVNEMRHQALGMAIEQSGLIINERYGTFASQRDIKHQFIDHYKDGGELWDRLSAYYDSNYLATVFAPLYPANARNCLWQVRSAIDASDQQENWQFRQQIKLTDIQTPWTSSDQWQELLYTEEYHGSE